MLSFTSSLSPDYEAFAIFVTEKYDYKDKKDILPNNVVQKINSFLDVLKAKKKDEELNSFDISNQKKCFIIKVKNKYEDYYPQEIGGALFSYIRKFKDIKKSIFRIKQSKSRYLMTTTFVNLKTNSNIFTGNWRPINLEKKPFNFPEPIITINENCQEMNGIYSDKCICLWEIEKLPDFS